MADDLNILDELDRRGLLADVTDRATLTTLLASGDPITFYTGYDPTAVSLHLGNLVPIIIQARLQRAGHRPIVVVGGATGMVGDPSGKSDERSLLDEATLTQHVEAIRGQLMRFLTFGDGPTDAVMANNADWFQPMGFLAFLRDVGKYLTVNYMTAKESVRARLEDREQGISYTEFSYMLLQAYDFVQLAESHGCRLQVGGSDQWGNITAGIELQRKLGRDRLFGMTCPLLLDASGQKMGKTSSGNRVWLDPAKTSPYAFYQYFMNVEDADVARLLKIFSWRSLDEIDEIVREHEAAPHRREGQRELATGITRWVHGEDAARRVVAASKVMFGGTVEDLSDEDLAPILGDLPSTTVSRAELEAGMPLLDVLAQVKLAQSKSAARRLVSAGGGYINNVRVSDIDATLTLDSLGTETLIILRAGKKKYHVLRVQK